MGIIDRKKYLSKKQLYKINTKNVVLNHYGSFCHCCMETEYVFLTIEHINNDGAEHRRSNKLSSGTQTVEWIIKNNFPENFTILCFNCNCARNSNGYCPHESNEQEDLPLDNRETI